MDSKRPRLRIECFITPTTPSKPSKEASLQPTQTCIRLLHFSRFLSLKHHELMRRKSCVKGSALLSRASLTPFIKKTTTVWPITRKSHQLRVPYAVLNLNLEAELGLSSPLQQDTHGYRSTSSATIRGRGRTVEILRTESRMRHGLLHGV